MIKDIGDLLVWQKARNLNKEIYNLTSSFPYSERANLVDQLRRASTSVCANIAEGFGRYHAQESMHFYRIARGSLSEIRSHLQLSGDQNYISSGRIASLLLSLDEIGKMLNGLINHTQNLRNNNKIELGSNN